MPGSRSGRLKRNKAADPEGKGGEIQQNTTITRELVRKPRTEKEREGKEMIPPC